MLNRRTFLQQTSVTLGSLAAGPLALARAPHQPIGAQLYTVRQQVEADLPGTLKQIRAIGYEEVEPFAGVYNRPASELNRMIVDGGLRAPSGHFNYDDFESKLDYATTLGMQFMVCPVLPGSVRDGTERDWRQACDRLNHLGEMVKGRGMRFCFHNHNYEFRPVGTTTGFDIMMQHTDPALVGFELDCYWVAQAGRDPLTLLREHKDRVRLLHLKDRKAGVADSQQMDGAAGHFAEVGRGTIAWLPLLLEARSLGIRHFFVEQDQTERPPLESLRISYDYLHRLIA